jgi:hypothetical protein
MTTAYQEQWLTTAPGRQTDRDGDDSFDCVDVPKDYAQSIWANTTWRDVWPQAGNAKDMFWLANTEYVDLIANDPSNTDQIPQRGDIIVYAGNGVNPYGHIAVVLDADQSGVDVVQQDTYTQEAMTVGHLAYDNYGTGPCTGWLRPKFDATVTVQAASITPIPVPEEDIVASIDDLKAALKDPEVLKAQYNAFWGGGDGFPLIFNYRLGRGEWPGTILGANEGRIQNEILPPALANIKATVDPAALAAAIPADLAHEVWAELGKLINPAA